MKKITGVKINVGKVLLVSGAVFFISTVHWINEWIENKVRNN